LLIGAGGEGAGDAVEHAKVLPNPDLKPILAHAFSRLLP
jgi:hypothetical protein